MVVVGIAVGAVAAMGGVGGGLFVVPFLHYGLRIPLRTAVGTSLLFILPTALSASVTEALRPSPAWDLRIVGVVLVGTIAGIQLGYRFSQWVSVRALSWVFAVSLTLAGLRLFFGAPAADAAGELGTLGAIDYLVAIVTGVGAGFAAPLLGIGGGLIMVPGLSLGLPALGFAGARACSLLVACFTASRSGLLYRREGAMRVDLGLALGAGALIGASLGVRLIHRPGWIEVARIGMVVILWIVAARFAREALRAPKPVEPPEERV